MREAYARGLSQALSRGVEKGENAILDQNAKQFLRNGLITPNVASHIATSGTGALIGASQDSENRLRGALIGAGTGLAGNRFIQAGTKAFFKNQTDNLAQNLPNIAKAKNFLI
ncbi:MULTISPECIES: hypothetical protein [unclassified Campylobacter]|uniref:hypothetical protein n=1 Tax=unclassified Campylobacter TaxID=2593542 RepID=UPI0022EA00A7|nr:MULTISPECIES: hypothetical protein [unclassified Campylobacter]MDA3062077.1 hypothetical protein [Campylobacter sp. JMF_14 EL1]MDA3072819.1 hypothetical protein [Campylobacter sp. JMF_10 EL2]